MAGALGNFGGWKLEAGIWKLEFGSWNLEAGIWKLEFGIWRGWSPDSDREEFGD